MCRWWFSDLKRYKEKLIYILASQQHDQVLREKEKLRDQTPRKQEDITPHCRLFHRSWFAAQIAASETAWHTITLHHTAAHCSTLQHTATHCNTLQHAATHCNTQKSPNCLIWHETPTRHNLTILLEMWGALLTRMFGVNSGWRVNWHGASFILLKDIKGVIDTRCYNLAAALTLSISCCFALGIVAP